MIASMQLDTSSYAAENDFAIVNLRAVVQDIHTRLYLFNSASEIFIRRHFKEAMRSFSSKFED